MTREEVKIIYERTCDAYPMFKPSNPQATFDLWVFYLDNFDFETVERNLDRHIRTSEFAPTIYQLCDGGNKKSGFMERRYTHEEFVEMERIALEELK